MSTNPTRGLLEELAEVFAGHGLATEAADELAREVVRSHPLAGRLGVPETAAVLARHGLDRESAQEAALFLAAWEELAAGTPFALTLEKLRPQARDEASAHGAAYAAAGFCRGAARTEPPWETGRLRALRAVLVLAAASGWVLLGGRLLAVAG